jgi:hypothetical protein
MTAQTSKYAKWESLMNAQSGFATSRPQNTKIIEFRPRHVLDSRIESDSFELQVQIPEDAAYELTLKETNAGFCKTLDCKILAADVCAKSGFYDIETTAAVPVRCKIVPGSSLDLVLQANWQDKKKSSKTQTLMSGTFVVPTTMDLFGAPGYRVYVPNLDACAYLGVGNVIDKETGASNLELLSFHVKIKFV